MQYSIYEIIRNGISFILTKIFHRPARLVRYPIFLRNKKNIHLNIGFTCGYNCRLEVIKTEQHIGKIIFGKNCKIGDNVHISSANEVLLGDNVLIASKVFITDCSHGDISIESLPLPSKDAPDSRPITFKKNIIGNNVWLGENVVILSGITIGDGVIVGASTVVTKDIPKNCMVAGIPAKIIKQYNESTKRWEVMYEKENSNIGH